MESSEQVLRYFGKVWTKKAKVVQLHTLCRKEITFIRLLLPVK